MDDEIGMYFFLGAICFIFGMIVTGIIFSFNTSDCNSSCSPKAEYQIDGTNVTCQDKSSAWGEPSVYQESCGFKLTDCSDGKEHYCVTNVIKLKVNKEVVCYG